MQELLAALAPPATKPLCRNLVTEISSSSLARANLHFKGKSTLENKGDLVLGRGPSRKGPRPPGSKDPAPPPAALPAPSLLHADSGIRKTRSCPELCCL